MIYSLKVKNIYSIGKEQLFDFCNNKLEDSSVAETKFGYVNKTSCVIGNNGSGKTSMLKAITFFKWLAEESFYKLKIDDLIPFQPHYLYENEPSRMEMIFNKKDKLFKLEFILNEKIILYEKLSMKKSNTNKFKNVYSVSRYNDGFKTLYSEYLPPVNKKERDRLKIKSNSSLFSYFLNTGALSHLGLTNIFNAFYSNLTEAGRADIPLLYECFDISDLLEKQTTLKQKEVIIDTLKTFDIGIEDISSDKSKQFIFKTRNFDNAEDKSVINFVHGKNQNRFNVPLLFESDGTIRSLSLLFPFLNVANEGGILIFDEIETSKHPNIIKKILSSFEEYIQKKNDVQILFSTHMPLLLENRNKSQIFLVEKTDCINSEIYRLDEVEGVRNDENFAVKYLSGRYGAVPRSEVEIVKET